MSTSTVSITANAVAARRRPVVAGEKKSAIELVGGDGGGITRVNGVAVGDDKTTGGGNDLSQSIRGEALLVRSNDSAQVKKTLANSTVSPRRTRKVAPKPEKARWLTVVSVLTKNLLLVLAVLGLVQMIRMLALRSADSSVASPLEISDFEGRIAEVEAFLKTTTKMMQVQVEVVDRKIENEIGGLRRELGKKIEDKGVIFGNELKKLDDRTENVEKSLGELRAMDLMTREEFEKFYDELKKAKSVDYSDRDVSLDDIRAYARDIIEKEIEKHAADGLGRVDYALASGGAMVIRHSEPYSFGKVNSWFPLTTARNGAHSDAGKMLKPSFGEPGQCFPLKGSSGFVQIRLRTAIILEAITLEHVAKSVAYDRSSAPKDCRVSGWLQGHDTDLAVDTERMFLLAEFSYDLDKSNAQTFNVLDSGEAGGSGIVDTIRFDFRSNHGSPSHTCIYRLRVHGQEPNAVSMLVSQS